MTRDYEQRINKAAERLMNAPLDRDAQRRHDDAYVRATKALDPDTPRYARVTRSAKRSA
jgi:hypothetical protein